jgi:hypothetical protein
MIVIDGRNLRRWQPGQPPRTHMTEERDLRCAARQGQLE